jgi:aspartate aminotransferase
MNSFAPFRMADRIKAIAVSEILQISAMARKLKASGRRVFDLSVGEPDFDTPGNVKRAGAAAIDAGKTKYTALDGEAGLKAAIQEKFARENNLGFAADEITVSAGAKQILYNALAATLNPDDEVIIPAPFWTSYLDIVAICGGKTVRVATSESHGFLLTPEDLERAITTRTRWLILNSPSNPSGAVYGAEQLRALGEVLMRHPQVWVLSDDIYEHVVYDDVAFASMAAVVPEIRNRTLTVNGVSKAYAMTGWRIGYAGGPAQLIKAMAVVQSQTTSCPSSISQAAALEALSGPQDFLRSRLASFKSRRDLLLEKLNQAPGLSCRKPEGAFYAYVNCSGVIGRITPHGDVIKSDAEFCRYLLEGHGVAVVPGSVFGLSPFFRVSYALAREALSESCDLIVKAASELKLPSAQKLPNV